MSKNIYNLFREYSRLYTPTQKSKYLATLSYDTRETFKSLIDYANNSDRFENIYDGWIENLDDELVVLEVYMFSEEFEQQKLKELREKVLQYLISKRMTLPKKLINEIYLWVDELKFPITNDIIPIATLKQDVEDALKKSTDLKKIVDNLIEKNRV